MNKNEFDISQKALHVFETMRLNLATVDSFLRNTYIEVNSTDIDQIELGFFGIASSKEQITIHNNNITTMIFIFLFQSLQNYFEIVKINPKLRDMNLEGTLSEIECSDEVIKSIRAIRNNIFHVPRIIQLMRVEKEIKIFNAFLNKKGDQNITEKLRTSLGDFTEKIFMGELKIYPDWVYAEIEKEEYKMMRNHGYSEEMRNHGYSEEMRNHGYSEERLMLFYQTKER